MGMSASQARFLTLTARKSDLELQAQQVSQKRVDLSNSSDEIEKEYSEKMNNRIFRFNNKENDTTGIFSYTAFKDESIFAKMYITNTNGKIIVASKEDIPKGADEKNYIVEPRLKEDGFFETQLKEGLFFITQDDANNEPVQKDLSMISSIVEEYDTTDDAAAQAEYDTKMKQIQKQDKKLELELDRIESDHKAIETEMDSVQKVIEKNVEDTFKTFG